MAKWRAHGTQHGEHWLIERGEHESRRIELDGYGGEELAVILNAYEDVARTVPGLIALVKRLEAECTGGVSYAGVYEGEVVGYGTIPDAQAALKALEEAKGEAGL